MNIVDFYQTVRSHSKNICQPLYIEDYIPQPIPDVSPPKWHLGHSTWFFETFILKNHYPDYRLFSPELDYLFNSYYENVGQRVKRDQRGFLTRPTVEEVYQYREYVDRHMLDLLSENDNSNINELVVLGCNHEQQHQELLWTDIKYILGTQPLRPAYSDNNPLSEYHDSDSNWIDIEENIYSIGYNGKGFCFDNELGEHQVKVNNFSIRKGLVTNEEYMKFIKDGGYGNVNLWHSEGWAWVNEKGSQHPLYWEKFNDSWQLYTMSGVSPVSPKSPVCHVNYYEASAYAEWAGARLPTEQEWEISADNIHWGARWEWTNSAYLPYPGYKKAKGAIGEYNGKFMVSQMVLRGASVATPKDHSRKTYRNFWHPWYQFQFSGIRLAK